MKKIIALSLAAVMIMLFCACSSGDSIVGSWKAEITKSGVTLTTTYTFNEDKTGKLSVMGTTVDFTYEVDGDKIIIKSNVNQSFNQTQTYVLKGDKLTLTSAGESVEYSRVKK